MGILELLRKRNLFSASTNGIEHLLAQKKPIYAGFDPTSDGLHVGNLLVLQTLKKFQLYGHPVVALVGGATGLIGDPSGKKSSRPFLSPEQIIMNVEGIRSEMQSFLGDVRVLNNADWLQMDVIHYLREYGKHFNIAHLVKMDTMKSRIDSGLSYTEFSYPLFQSIDFHHLYKDHGVMMQLGGSDQWGNIISGVELIQKKEGVECGGITIPLLTTSDGQKFGKSEGNAIWLNPKKTSFYQFYQYFKRIKDEDVIKLLYMLTDIDEAQISQISKIHSEKPENYLAQMELAANLTKVVHGDSGLQKALKSSEILYGDGKFADLPVDDIEILMKEFPSYEFEEDLIGSTLPNLFKLKGIHSSNQIKKWMTEGALSLNQDRITSLDFKIEKHHFINNKLIIVKTGKKNYYVFKRKI
jgi:tyrosyl-tRNA synthetase